MIDNSPLARVALASKSPREWFPLAISGISSVLVKSARLKNERPTVRFRDLRLFASAN